MGAGPADDAGLGRVVVIEGLRVLVGREQPGELPGLLAAHGAHAVHLPLITVVDPEDGGAALGAALGELPSTDWLVVTSVPGAERVGSAAAEHPDVRLAAVGSRTAQRLADLAGRPPDVVPSVQRGAALATRLMEVMEPASSVLLAVADRADPALGQTLSAAGHRVRSVVAYRTVLTPPDPATVPPVDALLLTSGSTARSWVEGMGTDRTPPYVVAMGPATAEAAREVGLRVDAVATEQSLPGLVSTLDDLVARARLSGRRDPKGVK